MKLQKGLSLVELLVAITLGLVLMGGVIQILTSSQASYRDLTNQARMQETAKLALEYIMRDLRDIGYQGRCSSRNINEANAVFGGEKYSNSQQLIGWEENELSGVPADDRTVGNFEIDPAKVKDDTDIVLITVTQSEALCTVESDTGAAYRCNPKPETDKGTIWKFESADCTNTVIFAQSNAISAAATVVGNTGSANLENCTNKHFGNYSCGTPTTGNTDPSGASGGTYPPGSVGYPVIKIAYTIEPGTGSGVFALRRHSEDEPDAGSQKLIEGITDLQFSYGIDTDQDGQVERFANAAQINGGSLSFKEVVSISVDITVQNPEDADQTEVYSTSAQLRNRGL